MTDQGGRAGPGTTADSTSELQALTQPLTGRQHRSGRQAGAALAAPSGQDGTTGAGTHAVAEAVLARAASVVRLVSALAHKKSFTEGGERSDRLGGGRTPQRYVGLPMAVKLTPITPRS